MNAAVVVAAGRGTRMGAGMNKVLLPVCGVPVIVRSVRALWESGLFDGGIVVVTGEEDRERIGRLLEEAGLRAVLCTGGADRQESVRRGLAALPRETELVAIHDGARPLVTRGVLAASLESAGTRGSGVAAMPARDTIKRADENGRAEITVRGKLPGSAQLLVSMYGTELDAQIKVTIGEEEGGDDPDNPPGGGGASDDPGTDPPEALPYPLPSGLPPGIWVRHPPPWQRTVP